MDILALVAALTVMGAVVFALLAIYATAASPRTSLERRLGHVIGESTGVDVRAGDSQALRPRRAGRLPIISTLLEGKQWTADMAMELERGDFKLTVGEFVALRIFLALMGAGLPLLLLGNQAQYLGLAGMLALVGYVLPQFYLRFAQKRRIRHLDGQLVEALTMVANSLKAGFGLSQSWDLVARELPHPISTEIRRMLHDINVGMLADQAMQNMARRCGSTDLDIVITAMLIQQSTGGNLAEILENVAHTMRERIRIRGEITTLASQQVLSGVIIGVLPFVIAGFIIAINPNYIDPLFHDLAGQMMLGGALVMEIFGVVLIKKILDIEV